MVYEYMEKWERKKDEGKRERERERETERAFEIWEAPEITVFIEDYVWDDTVDRVFGKWAMFDDRASE